MLSDRNSKKDFCDLDGEVLLSSVRRLWIPSWRYDVPGSVARHVGPMAQGFRAEFGLGLGHDDKTLAESDQDPGTDPPSPD